MSTCTLNRLSYLDNSIDTSLFPENNKKKMYIKLKQWLFIYHFQYKKNAKNKTSVSDPNKAHFYELQLKLRLEL